MGSSKRIKRIILIQTPVFTALDKESGLTPNMPLGLSYIASVLERENYEVKILDAFVEGWNNEVQTKDDRLIVGMSYKEIESIISDFKPDVVGISALFTSQRFHAHKTAEITKKIDSNIKVVIGGPHPTVAPEMVIQDKNVDFTVIGEGEDSFLSLLKELDGENKFGSLDGIAFRERDRTVILPKTRFIKDLDALPFPARHLLPIEKYFKIPTTHGGKSKHYRHANIVTSRGCPAKCTFCSAYRVWGRGYRVRSAKNVLEEMKHLKETYHIGELRFEDDNLTLNKKRAIEIFDGMVKEEFNFSWDTPNGVAAFTLDEEVVKKMKESGCYRMNLAVESGNQHVLSNIIKKPLKLEKVERLIKYARKIHLETGLFFVVGMPGETLSQMRESFRFSKKLGVYRPHISIATPYPGTELLSICKKNNYLFKNYNLDDLLIFKHSFETSDWKAEDIDRLLKEEWITISILFDIKHPFKFLKRIFKNMIHPVIFFKRVKGNIKILYRKGRNK